MRPFPPRYYDAERARKEYAPNELPKEAPPDPRDETIRQLQKQIAIDQDVQAACIGRHFKDRRELWEMATAKKTIKQLREAVQTALDYFQREHTLDGLEAMFTGDGYEPEVQPIVNALCAALERKE